MSSADLKLDAQLRAVAPPSGLLERLMAIPYADDAGLDEIVRDVEVPEGLSQRLAAIPLADDEGLDEALRNVPVPRKLATSLRRQATRRPRPASGCPGAPVLRPGVHGKNRPLDRALRISRIAMALSLIVAVTLSLGSALVLSWLINKANDSTVGPSVAKESGHVAPVTKEPSLETSLRYVEDDGFAGIGSRRNGNDALTEDENVAAREIDLASLESAAERAGRESIVSGALPAGVDPLAMVPMTGELPVSHDNWDNLTELPWRPTSLIPHGLDWPLAPGSNRKFLIDKKIHPFVQPLAGSVLQGCSVPLAAEPASYELTRRYLERSEMPPADSVRTEDFLAAMDYRFPKPFGRGLGLIVAGGQSPISGEDFSLLQLGVQAWQGDSQHAPLHLVLLVDTSTSMRWGSRMEIVRRALTGLPELLGPKDRVSLVTFNQAAHVLVENLGAESISQLRAAASSLSAEGSTNFLGGFREACSVARDSLGPGRPAVRMVLLTDGLLDLDPAATENVQKQAAEASRQKIRVDVIDLGQQQKDADPQLVALSRAGQGGAHRATSAEQIRWAFREIVTGRSQLVARAARLRVTFNPKAVLEYRIIGHESNDWAGMLPGSLEADFREGQAATGLFELRLAPDAPDDVARVDLTWYTPSGNGSYAEPMMRRETAVVHRGQFGGALASSPPWFQEAAVAAYMAEVLRHSPFIFPPHIRVSVPAALHRAHELSENVDQQLRHTPFYEEFVDLIDREIKAHPARTKIN